MCDTFFVTDDCEEAVPGTSKQPSAWKMWWAISDQRFFGTYEKIEQYQHFHELQSGV